MTVERQILNLVIDKLDLRTKSMQEHDDLENEIRLLINREIAGKRVVQTPKWKMMELTSSARSAIKDAVMNLLWSYYSAGAHTNAIAPTKDVDGLMEEIEQHLSWYKQ